MQLQKNSYGIYLDVSQTPLDEIFQICNRFGGRLDVDHQRIYFLELR